MVQHVLHMEEAKLVEVENFSYNQISELCAKLRKVSTVNENVRRKVLEIVQEVKEEFTRNLERWWDHGLDAEVQALSKRLLEAFNLLAEGPDEVARREWCIAAKTIAIELEIIRRIHS